MKDNDNRNNIKIRGIISSAPKACADAILSSTIAALLVANVLTKDGKTFLLAVVMLLCAAVSVALETVRMPKAVYIIIPAVSALCGAAYLVIPRGEEGQNLLTMILHGESTADALIVPFICGCFILCSVVSVINGSFILRCAAAGAAVIFLVVLALMKKEIMALVLMLMLSYILIVVCQVASPSVIADDQVGHNQWHVLLCVLAAVIAVSIPAPKTRIPWEKLVHVRTSEQLDSISDALDIDTVDQLPETGLSGYDDDASSLGGWLELADGQPLEVAFPDGVRTDRLGGSIFDSYDGMGWYCTIRLTGTGYVSSSDVSSPDVSLLVVSSSDAATADRGLSRAVVTRINDRSETVFIPPHTVYVETSDGSEYSRVASRLALSDKSCRQYTSYFREDSSDCAILPFERNAYLALPDDLPPRVREYAELLTSGRESDADKAEAIMNALSLYRYETQVGKAPEGSDFVDHFLFVSREGYCEYFASAMAVLARCVNIPSRFVIGYVVPESNTDHVRISAANAHAWAELYVEGQGWKVYDPASATAAFELLEQELEEQSEKADSVHNGVEAVRKMLLYSSSAIAGMVLLIFTFRPFVKRIISSIRLARRHGSKAGFAVLRRCRRTLWTLSACGVDRRADETPQELCRRVISECSWLAPSAARRLSLLMERCEEVLYSHEPSSVRAKSAAGAIRHSFIKANGLFRFIRGWWRADA